MLGAQSRQSALEQRQCPAALVGLFWCQFVKRLATIALLADAHVEGQNRPAAAAFLRPSLAPLFREEMIQRRKQKRTKLAAFAIGNAQAVRIQQPGEELLRQIAGLVGIVPAPPDVGVKGIPVGFAEHGEGLLCGRRGATARRRHDAPMRRGKPPAMLR